MGDKLKRHIIVFCLLGFFLTLVLLSLPTYAEECSPIQFSLWSPIQLVPKDKVVCGVRLDLLWGDNAEVWGLDAGLVNIAGAFKGLQIGGVNWLHIKDGGMSYGVQLGMVNYATNMTGVQVGTVNAATNMTGIQIAFENITANQMRGCRSRSSATKRGRTRTYLVSKSDSLT